MRAATGWRPAGPAGTHPQPAHPPGSLVLRATSGEAVALDSARWHGPATPDEMAVLGPVTGPVVDLGCGPGRLVVGLASRGVPALGVDCSPAAVTLARRRGAPVLERDLFAPLPGEGRWRTVLLFDGNIGIGGDPVRLLARCRRLAAPDGRVLVEVGPPGSGLRAFTGWLERDGDRGPRLPWAVVGAEVAGEVAAAAGLAVTDVVEKPAGRWFAWLGRAR